MDQLDLCGHYTSELWTVKENALEELANMDSVNLVLMQVPTASKPSESGQIVRITPHFPVETLLTTNAPTARPYGLHS